MADLGTSRWHSRHQPSREDADPLAQDQDQDQDQPRSPPAAPIAAPTKVS